MLGEIMFHEHEIYSSFIKNLLLGSNDNLRCTSILHIEINWIESHENAEQKQKNRLSCEHIKINDTKQKAKWSKTVT